jgi:hypothetical protein
MLRLVYWTAFPKVDIPIAAASGGFQPLFALSGHLRHVVSEMCFFDNRILWLTTLSTPDKIIN